MSKHSAWRKRSEKSGTKFETRITIVCHFDHYPVAFFHQLCLVIEQLPLTIHRLFTLIRQLDCQACGASCRFYLKELNGGPTWSSQTILTVYFQKSINMSNCAINSTRMGLNLLNQQRWNGVLCHSQVLPMVSQYALDIIIFVHKEQ